MGLKVPAGTDLTKVGIPGVVEKVEWGNWEQSYKQGPKSGTTEKREGLLWHMKGWDNPQKVAVKFNGDGSWDGNSHGGKLLSRLVELGVTTHQAIKNGEFDFDWFATKTVVWGDTTPYANFPDFKQRIIVDVPAMNPAAEEHAATQGPEDFIVELLRKEPLSPQQLVTNLITSGRHDVVEAWHSGLSTKMLTTSLETRDGKLAVRA